MLTFQEKIESVFAEIENSYTPYSAISAIENFNSLSSQCKFPYSFLHAAFLEKIRMPRFKGIGAYAQDVETINNYLLCQICSYVFFGVLGGGEINASMQNYTHVRTSCAENKFSEVLVCVRFSSDFDDKDSFQIDASKAYKKHLA